jgi:hypothetical protein
MESNPVQVHDEPVKTKKVDALPSASNARYWSQRIDAILQGIAERGDALPEPLEPLQRGR